MEHHREYRHAAVLYGTDAELLEVVAPFVAEGVAASEPVLLVLQPRTARIVREALGVSDGVTYVPGEEHYSQPAGAIQAYRRLLAQQVAAGARRIRAVGEVPVPEDPAHWHSWGRYEAAVNDAYAEFPLHVICPYDTRSTPAPVLDEVTRTHPYLASPSDERAENPRYELPLDFVSRRAVVSYDPLEHTAPVLDLVASSAAEVRAALERVATSGGLGRAKLEAFAIAVGEATTNALTHGAPPVVVRAWWGTDRLVVTVRDAGPGPDDPFAGLSPADRPGHAGGVGLWLAHHLCDDLALVCDEQGFTVRLTAYHPPA